MSFYYFSFRIRNIFFLSFLFVHRLTKSKASINLLPTIFFSASLGYYTIGNRYGIIISMGLNPMMIFIYYLLFIFPFIIFLVNFILVSCFKWPNHLCELSPNGTALSWAELSWVKGVYGFSRSTALRCLFRWFFMGTKKCASGRFENNDKDKIHFNFNVVSVVIFFCIHTVQYHFIYLFFVCSYFFVLVLVVVVW